VAAAALALTCVALAGCTDPAPSLTSPWPPASVEATIPMPPEAMRWPLTGLAAPSIDEIDRVPLSLKIDGANTRGQVGLGSADVVYEWADTDGNPQLNAVFQSALPPVAGPVADATVLDLSIVSQYRALLFSKSATASVMAVETQAKMTDLSRDGGVTSPYVDAPRKSLSGVYVDTAEAYAAAVRLGTPISGDPARLRFGASLDATQPILGVTVPLSSAWSVTWSWRPNLGVYLRDVGGTRHYDAVTRKQVSATNVVVMWVKGGSTDQADPTQVLTDSALVGTGQVTVLRDGTRVDGKWKAEPGVPPRFFAEDGTPITLGPGNTWFEVIPGSANITLR
jgi:hypothetical protein